MPIYEYFCPKCKSKFELLRPISCAEQDAACARCQTQSRRVPSAFSAFNRSGGGEPVPIAGAGGGCSACGATSCSSCS
ncbi:MAG: zinc ribbon domain-containing protein [Chloroflexi bacterium]|nr:zinc ribbon domain-containing protein [Chloroflexota bacterium]